MATCTCRVTDTKPVILILIGSILGFTKVSDISTRYKILVMIEAQDIVLRIYSW